MTNLNYFEDSRLWLSKKFYLSSSTSNYVLSYNSSQAIPKNSQVNYQSVLSAYLQDYNLATNNLSLRSLEHSSALSNSSVFYSTDNTIYQDSYNSYLLALSSTTLNTNFNNYKYSSVKSNGFKYSL
jgi:hypothetical protein